MYVARFDSYATNNFKCTSRCVCVGGVLASANKCIYLVVLYNCECVYSGMVVMRARVCSDLRVDIKSCLQY